MAQFKQRTRMISGNPIVVGERRLLPTVLVKTLEGEMIPGSPVCAVQLQPASLVEEGPEGERWHNIPYATRDALSSMGAAAAGIALAGSIALLLIWLARGGRR